MYAYGLNVGPSAPLLPPPPHTHTGVGPSWNLGPSFEQTWQTTTRQCYKPNFKHLSQVVLKKIVEYFSMYFYGSSLRHLARGHLEPWGLHLKKLGKNYLTMLHIKFQSSGPSGSTEEVAFLIYFYAFLWFKPRPPSAGSSWPDPRILV